MRPDASKHDPRPAYLRRLIERAGMTPAIAAVYVGISERTMFNYLQEAAGNPRAPYAVQFALESLAASLAVPAPTAKLHLVYNGLTYSWPLALTPP